MPLSAQEEVLLGAFRRLSPDKAIDWSDSWSDEDMREFTAESLRRLQAEERETSH